MPVAVNTYQMKLQSGPYGRRVGLIPMMIALGASWFYVCLWLVLAVYIYQYNPPWSIILLASTIGFSALLTIMSSKLVHDFFCEYIFELNESEAVLVVVDKLLKRRATQMVLLNDVKYAEFYPFQDSASIVLHTAYVDMEVPLWPMGEHGQDVVDFLDGMGVPVVNVQSDNKIPD